METHSSILAWRIPWRSLAGYSPWGHKEMDTAKRLSTCAPKTTLPTAVSNRVARSRGFCHRRAPAWEPSPSRPSSPTWKHKGTERECDWLKVTQQVLGRATKRTPAHVSPSLGFPEGGCQPAIPAFPSPGLPGCSRPPVVYDPQKPLRSVSGGEALGHRRWARPAPAQAAADRLCVRRPGTPSH